MRTRFMFSIGVAALLILGLSLCLTGHTLSASGYTLVTGDGLALTLTADGQISGLHIDGQALVSTPAPALVLRDLSDAGTVTTPNLLSNPGFEVGLNNWGEWTNNGLSVHAVVSPTHTGGQALEFTNPLTTTARFAAYASDPVPVNAGQRYRVSAWWRSASGYVTHPAGPPTLWQMRLWRDTMLTNALYVQWLDGNSHPLGQPQLAVPLHWNAGHWRLIRRELAAPPGAAWVRVAVGASLQGETLWVDDVAFVPSPEPDVPLGGTVIPCPGQSDCLQQTVVSGNLAFTLTYTAHAHHIAVHGEVQDLSGRNRALDLTWGVPFEPVSRMQEAYPQGGPPRLWWDDVHSSRQITQAVRYANAISAIYDGWLPMSLYPYAGVQLAGKGVALGLPLDRPQLALLAYDGATGRYGSTFHLGISSQAVKVGPRATIDLMLYRFDPTWGFRDVMARHQALQPQAYTTDISFDTYVDYRQGQFFTPSGAQQVLSDDAANIYTAQYTVGEFHLDMIPESELPPTLDQALEVLTDTLNSPSKQEVASAQATINSAVVDPNGDWSIKKLGVFPWSHGMWEMVWTGNADPDIEAGLGQYMRDWLVTPAFTATLAINARLDGVEIDNFQAVPTFDLRPEALAAADTPLSHTPHTYQPAVHTGFAFREYLAMLRQHLDTNWGADRGISINFWGLGNPNYLAEYIDAFGGEGKLDGTGAGDNWSPDLLDYRRAIISTRTYRFGNQTSGLTASEAYTFTQMVLLYGVRPAVGPNAAGWEPQARQLVSDTINLVDHYWAAGWEPLTYARADSEDIWIERFGDLTPHPRRLRRHPLSPLLKGEGRGGRGEWGEVYFPVHNHTTLTRTTAITIETASLGLTDPASATITDLASSEMLSFNVVSGNIVLDLELGPWQTRILQVSGGVQQPTATPTPTPSPFPLYLPLVYAKWRLPTLTPTASPTPTPDVTIRADLTQPGSPLSTLLKPSANLHPMWGDRNEAPIAWWQAEVPRWQEGTYFFDLDLFHIEEGAMNLAQGRYPDTLTRFAGPEANAFIDIDRVPASLEPPECLQEENYPRHQDTARCAPTSYEAYQKVLEALLTYLSVPDVVMPDNQATEILHIAGQPSLGLDGLNYIFWHEANSVGWWDTTAAWFELYDYWIAAVRNVRNAYPGVHFKMGTEFMGDNRLVTYEGWQRNHQDLLSYLDLFLSFLNGNPPKGHEDYQYRAQPPLDLEFYAFNPRNNLNYHWINDWPDGFYQEIQDRFAQYGFGNMTYVAWALESGHTQVNAPVRAGSEPDRRYLGAERDSEMGAAAQIALQYDVERSPVIPISHAWAEFFSDVGEDVNDFLPWDFPLYCGGTGNAFTYAYYAKPTYNVMRMLGMQERTRVPAQITDTVSPSKRDYVGAVVTRDKTGQHMVVLLWYYIPPEDLENVAGRRYEDLRAYADAHLRTDVEVVLDGLGGGSYRLERYLVDETHSNGFHYRQQIADAKVPAEEVNGWLPGNNLYGASVALERVEARDGVSPAGGTLRLRYAGVAPWTVMLIDLRAD